MATDAYTSLTSCILFDDAFGVELAKYDPEPEEHHNLSIGAPRKSHLRAAADVFLTATESLVKSDYGKTVSFLQYGPLLGSGRFRREMAKFLSDMYGDEVLPQNVMQTGEFNSRLSSVVTALLPRDATVYVEDPTFFAALSALKTMKRNVVSVLCDEDGMKIDELQSLLEAQEEPNTESNEGLFNSMVYMIPTFHNPTGVCYSPERIAALIQMARRFNVLLFCDDVYNILHYDTPPPRMLTYDTNTDSDYKGHVISCGTFSKILAPGVRLGWIEANDRIIHAMMKSSLPGGSISHYVGEVVTEAMSLSLVQQHLSMVREDYGRITAWVCSTLRKGLPQGCSLFQPKGGCFVWLQLPLHCDATELARLALEKYKLIIMPGQGCSLSGSFHNCIRFTFIYLEEDALKESMKKLCECVRQYMGQLQQ